MSLSAVRSLASASSPLATSQELEDFEQELVDQYALACSAAGTGDAAVASDRRRIFSFARFISRRVWTATTDDADRYLKHERDVRRLTGQVTLTRTAHHQRSDIVAANRAGQQLFIVDLLRQKHDRLNMAQNLRAAAQSINSTTLTHFPVSWRQQRLFDTDDALRDLTAGRDRGLPDLPLPGLAVALLNAVAEHAAQHGWGQGMQAQAEHVVRVLLSLQDTPGAAITISETVKVTRELNHCGARAVQEVLGPLGMLIDDRRPILQDWFDQRAIGLSDSVDRYLAVIGLRSLFRILKAHRIVFTNPTSRLRQIPQRPTKPLPADLDDLLKILHSSDTVRAALAAIIAYHALRNRELRELRLADVHDGRIHLRNRTVLLTQPAMKALSQWLDERARRWPNTLNPHLFVNYYTAVRTMPVSGVWVSKTLGMPMTSIRDDRILAEALATEGDARRLSDLFGLNITSASRYTHITDDIASPT